MPMMLKDAPLPKLVKLVQKRAAALRMYQNIVQSRLDRAVKEERYQDAHNHKTRIDAWRRELASMGTLAASDQTPSKTIGYTSRKANEIKDIIRSCGGKATLSQINERLRNRGYAPAQTLVSFMQRDSVLKATTPVATGLRGRPARLYTLS